MESDINKQIIGIYWDLNTCQSKDIQLFAQKIRELYVKTNINNKEKEFLCSTVGEMNNQKELKDNHNIGIVYSPEKLYLSKFLIDKIEKHVNESIICDLKPVVVLITDDYYLAKVLLRIRSSAESVLIYGHNLKQDFIRLVDKSLPFINLELMVLNSDQFRAANKKLSLNCFGKKRKKKPYEKLMRELRGESGLNANNISTKCGEKSNYFWLYFSFIYYPLVFIATTLLAHFTTNAIFKHLCDLLFESFTKTSAIDEEIHHSFDSYVRISDDINNNDNNLSSIKSGSKESQLNYDTKNVTITGVCGLRNLGNTCFMNSALQCLSNIPIFTKFALNYGLKLKTQNKNEPKLLLSYYCEVIAKLWSAKCTIVSPDDFRLEVSKNFLQFGSHLQNDCSEFLTLILDRFHEELRQLNGQNNITNDEIILYQCFADYLKANNTFIANNFHGFQRYSLSCDCGQTLLTNLNPFSVLSLPYLNDKTNDYSKLTVYLMLSNTSSNFNINSFEIHFSNDRISINNILTEVTILYNKHYWDTTLIEDNLIVAQIHNHQVIYLFKNNDYLIISQIIGEIYLYERDPKFAKQLFINTLSFKSLGDVLPFGIPLMININDSSFYSINTAFKQKFTDFMFEKRKFIECEEILKEFKLIHYLIPIEEDEYIEYYYYSHDYGLPNHQVLYVKNISFKLKQLFKMPPMDPVIPDSSHMHLNYKLNIKLDDALDHYLSIKKLTENEQILCSKCQTYGVPNEKLDIIYAPNVLLIQLKSNTSYFRKNMNDFREYNCDFLLTLNLDKHIMNATQNDQLIYDLIAISNYKGNDFGGHYTTFARNYGNKKWYHFNDSFVEEISEELVFTSNAYLLVYLKRNLNSSLID